MHDEMDILREVGSISAGQGSVALSEILGKRINLRMPSLDLLSTQAALNKINMDQIVISICCNILTGLKGNILFILDEKSAFRLIDTCYRIGEDNKKSGHLTEMGLSLVKEVGNVVISSFVGALSMMLKTLIIPSIPTFVSGSTQQIINMISTPNSGNDYILLVEAIFEESEQRISGSFYLALNADSVQFIQDSCKKLLESIKND